VIVFQEQPDEIGESRLNSLVETRFLETNVCHGLSRVAGTTSTPSRLYYKDYTRSTASIADNDKRLSAT
jgi:hypothetical protein